MFTNGLLQNDNANASTTAAAAAADNDGGGCHGGGGGGAGIRGGAPDGGDNVEY